MIKSLGRFVFHITVSQCIYTDLKDLLSRLTLCGLNYIFLAMGGVRISE